MLFRKNEKQSILMKLTLVTGEMLTFVGNGNLEGSVLQGVWMAVSGGGHD